MINLKSIKFLVCFLIMNLSLYAQKDSLHSKSSLNFLSSSQYQQYTTGKDISMGLIAKVNGYPSPIDVLVLSKKIGLSETQKNSINTVLKEMNRKIIEMGKFIIAEETNLNKLFENKTINEGSLVFYTNKIGALQGELRNAYLKAHIKTFKILTPTQLKKYAEISN